MKFQVWLHSLQADSDYHCLDTLCRRADFNVHQLCIERADLLEESTYFQARSDRQDFLKRCALTQEYESTYSKQFIVGDSESLEQAEKLAQTPLTLLVEDADSDGALVRVALRVHADSSLIPALLDKPPSPPALKIEHGGGSTRLRRIKNLAEEGKNQLVQLRVMAIQDSDSPSPGKWSEEAQDVDNKCKQLGVPCHTLKKRSSENYLPDSFWEVLEKGHPLLQLDLKQRDHICHGSIKPNPCLRQLTRPYISN